MLIAHITDTHIKLPGKLAYQKVDTAHMLRQAVEQLNAWMPRPDLVVVTGDLVDHGHPDEYRHLRSILDALQIPLVVVAGNHDERQALRQAFPDHTYLPAHGYLHFAINDRFPLRIIGLDTVVPYQGGGLLCQERLDWLSDQLSQYPDHPTLIAMHHPPFISGIAHMDKVGLQGREAFADLVAHHPQVQAILCGHLHRNMTTLVGGRRALTVVSPAHQVVLDLHPDGPSQFCMEPPGFAVHHWNHEQLVSHFAVLGQFPGPYPFFGPDGRLID